MRSSLTSKITSNSHRAVSPSRSRLNRSRSLLLEPTVVLPADIRLHISIPFTTWTWIIWLDVRRFGEAILLLCSLFFAVSRFTEFPFQKYLKYSEPHIHDVKEWLSIGNVLKYLCPKHFIDIRGRTLLSRRCSIFISYMDPQYVNE
jgi:hypothetical protein